MSLVMPARTKTSLKWSLKSVHTETLPLEEVASPPKSLEEACLMVADRQLEAAHAF